MTLNPAGSIELLIMRKTAPPKMFMLAAGWI